MLTQSRATRTIAKKATARSDTRTLGIEGGSAVELVQLVRAGFLFSRVIRFEKVSGLSRDLVARFAGIPLRTLARRQSEGKLQSEESDRVLRAAAIFDLAVGLFEGDVAAARRWLLSAQVGLGNEIPLEFASTTVGARAVEDLIGRLEDGVVA